MDRVAARGHCDFVEAIAVPLPLLLIAEMIGIPREDQERFHQWSDAMIAAEGNLSDPSIMERAARAFLEYSGYLTDIIEARRREPREDLVSVLVGARDEGVLGDLSGGALPLDFGEEHARLADDELVMFLVLLLVAGNETTRNAISGGMELLIRHPEERRKLLQDPARIPAAVEEMVRMVSPVLSFGRTVTRDCVLGDQPLRAGDKVLMVYPSANRDETVYEEPDRFRVDRDPNHLAFGLGPHFCLGANLARMEMRVAFTELLRRLPDMEFASEEGAVLQPSALVRSCVRMEVRFTPEGGGPGASL